MRVLAFQVEVMSSDENTGCPSRSRSSSPNTLMETDEHQSPPQSEGMSHEAEADESTPDPEPEPEPASTAFLKVRSPSKLLENDEAARQRQITTGHLYSKRPKTELATKRSRAKMIHTGRTATSNRKEPICEICRQKLQDKDLKEYAGHPNDAVDEYNAVIDEKLSLFNGEEEDVIQHDWRAINKITFFKYNNNSHLQNCERKSWRKVTNLSFACFSVYTVEMVTCAHSTRA